MKKKDFRLAPKGGIPASRLDVPGFSYGIKTGEFIDVPSVFGGKPRLRPNARPHAWQELATATTVTTARKAKQLTTAIAKEDYNRRKRRRTREYKAPVTNCTLPQPCNRRFFEHMGDKAGWLDYNEEPELFISKAKSAYEINDGFVPILTTTSAREALIVCATLARYGIAAYFNRIDISRL